MKALVTGMTAMQCGSERTRFKITCAGSAWATALRSMNYETEHRRVELDEKSWQGYDVVLVGLSCIMKRSAANIYTILRLLAERPDAIVFVDDWDTRSIFSSFKATLRGDRLWTCPLYSNADEAKHKHGKKIDKIFNGIATMGWSNPTLVCTHGMGGDLTKLELPGQLVPIDPTAFVSDYSINAMTKQRRWLWASLARKGKQLATFHEKSQWPIEVYDKIKPEELGERCHLNKMIKEPELLEQYASSWGLIMPGHPRLAGSGWWRVRYKIARDLGCVVSAPAEDAALIGPSFVKAVDPSWVESLDDKKLKALARSQKNEFDALTMSAEDVKSILHRLIKETK